MKHGLGEKNSLQKHCLNPFRTIHMLKVYKYFAVLGQQKLYQWIAGKK